MLASTLLIKKRDGHRLEDDEIRFLIEGFCSGAVADYQMSAFAMAVCLMGMDERETATLTRAMLDSGNLLPRQQTDDGPPRVDKHSTGGLGDKVSLILAPLLAACGLHVPMISGRGLGLSGGTLDKLESIPGFQVDLSVNDSTKVLEQVGTFIVGANERIAPADRRLYALRDVTGTVESVPLITASILSKKLAANLDALVMDVKTGSGAFMKTHEQASRLARSLVQVGGQAGLPTTALLTDMDQPLGHAVGNAIEVNESVDVLTGGGGVVRDLTIDLCAVLLVQVGHAVDMDEARRRLSTLVDDGSAMERFEKMVRAQGGNLDGPLSLAPAHDVIARQSGYVARFDCDELGRTVVSLGGGRQKTGDMIDPTVGIQTHQRIGDHVEKGDPILTLHCPATKSVDYLERLNRAVEISEAAVDPRPLILERLDD